MNPEEQFFNALKANLPDTTVVNVNSYDLTDMFKDNPRTKPEDVFTVEQLDKWARDNGYVKFY